MRRQSARLRGSQAAPAWVIALPALVVVVGCGAKMAGYVEGPDGRTDWMQIKCPSNMGKCRAKASELCPNGYEVGSERDGSRWVQSGPTHAKMYEGELIARCHR